jgi:hypothetical protein
VIPQGFVHDVLRESERSSLRETIVKPLATGDDDEGVIKGPELGEKELGRSRQLKFVDVWEIIHHE